ncbi:hypothetical protein N7474_003950 [Penicillium riverlandense]|uniref:uncharacterized protein n=1 Tax=Penicillium riverlandense TaxID=1903569 RepID=UPI0025478690|nr:uncharacterized protein N7474_003950 [Penicillium riverlandense]KAJ5818359.1 hypothetical protein N7474_003950 [Penicillium riverlandense]
MAEGGVKRAASPTRAISPPPVRRKVESTVTKKSMASFFTPTSQKKPEPITWRIVQNSLVIGRYTPDGKTAQQPAAGQRKIAAFDLVSAAHFCLEGRLIGQGTHSPNRQRIGNGGTPLCRIVYKNSTLRGIHPSPTINLPTDLFVGPRFQVVVVSNQKKISLKKDLKGGHSDSKSLATFKEKTTAVMTQLEVPLSVYAATENDEYRKPRMGMWREFLDDYDLDVAGVDLSGSVFVGDAAGRPGDHSSTDRGFAANIGIPFKTPEEFFLGQASDPLTEVFDPSLYTKSSPDQPVSKPFSRKHPLELVIFCGSPGAGKSTFYWNHMEPLGYERVNQDKLGTRPKCLKVAREHLEAKKSVAVDNTNADLETRAYWTSLAKELNVPIRCVQFISSPELCRHNNAVRAANKELNPESRSSVPGIAFGSFASRFKEPTLDEGFEDIIPVRFQFQGSEDARKVWGQYWI